MTHLTEISVEKRRDPRTKPQGTHYLGITEMRVAKEGCWVPVKGVQHEEQRKHRLEGQASINICKKERQVTVSDAAERWKDMGTKNWPLDLATWRAWGPSQDQFRVQHLDESESREKMEGRELKTRSSDTPVRSSVVKHSWEEKGVGSRCRVGDGSWKMGGINRIVPRWIWPIRRRKTLVIQGGEGQLFK